MSRGSLTEERQPMGWRCRFNPDFLNYILLDEEETIVLSKFGLHKVLDIIKENDKLEKFIHSKFKDFENRHGLETICSINLDNPMKFRYPVVFYSETICYKYKAGILINVRIISFRHGIIE